MTAAMAFPASKIIESRGLRTATNKEVNDYLRELLIDKNAQAISYKHTADSCVKQSNFAEALLNYKKARELLAEDRNRNIELINIIEEQIQEIQEKSGK